MKNYQNGDNLLQELEVLKSLQHKNIVKVHEYINDPNSQNVHIVLQYLSGGTLQEKLDNQETPFTEELARKYFRQILSGVHYCHEVKNLAHRDLKPENMMLDAETGALKLCDFGVA